MGHISGEGEQATKSIQWVGWADNEYIAARLLLLNNALVQGSGISNTTIEKYLKALFVLLGLKIPKGFKGHNICNLYDEIKKKGLELKISEEYLALLFKSYRLRYFDDLKPGFNIALDRTKLLVELDHTVYEIRKGFNFGFGDKKLTTKLEQFQENKDPVLLNKNCYFGNYDRSALFGEECSCYELRVLEDGIMEIYYLTKGIDDDGKFDTEGLKPKEEGKVDK
jgi:hypothetical protein